jgi:hypothetical protein
MAAVEIANDIQHPEGGHALIRFRGATGPLGPARLQIEPLTEGVAYDGPRDAEVVGTADADGVTYAVAGGALDKLETGVPVTLSIAGTSLTAQVVWPELPTLRAPPQPRVRVPPPRRTVVERVAERATGERPPAPESEAAGGEPRPAPEVGPAEDPGAATAPPAPPPALDDRKIAAFWGDRETAAALAAGRAEAPPPRPEIAGSGAVAALPRERSLVERSAVSRGNATLVGAGVTAGVIVGLLLGTGVARQPLQPAPPSAGVGRAPASAHLNLLSPYHLLHDLPSRSPEGFAVEERDPIALLRRASSAKSDAEKEFWVHWAMRAALEQPDGRPAAQAIVLNYFAAALAKGQTDPTQLAIAEFLWEMAAVGNDCVAMSDIAVALRASGDSADAGTAATWQARSQQCQAKGARSQ